MGTYWLPVSHLKPAEARSIISAFCRVFDDCSLWASLPYEWMLLGTRNFRGPSDLEHFARLWKDPVSVEKMNRLGFFFPEEFGMLFIADGERLAHWLGGALPLTDNYPGRISQQLCDETIIEPDYLELMEARGSSVNFKDSPLVRNLWGPRMQEAAQRFFPSRDFIFKVLGGYEGMPLLTKLHRCLQYPYLKMFMAWALESDPDAQAILTEALSRHQSLGVDQAGEHLAARAVIEGDYELAEHYYAQLSERSGPEDDAVYGLRLYLLYRAGARKRMLEVAEEYIGLTPQGAREREEKVKKLISWLESNISRSPVD